MKKQRIQREKLYNTWTDIKRRAKKQNTYVCDEWRSNYQIFKVWADANGYEEGKVSLVRIDNSKGFEPANCKFIEKYAHGKKHGGYNSKLYSVWQALHQKCNNPNNPHYSSFGGRGIKVCTEWDNFVNFQKWAELNDYREGLLIDRKDLNGSYTPSNCMFTSKKEHSATKNSPIISKRGSENPAYKHGKYNTRLHNIWDTMKQRCTNINRKDFENYGGRGIKVCDEWLDFNNFYNWAMNNGYEEGLTIERKDFDGNYEPINCEWVTLQQQARNKRQNHFVTINGETKTIAEWSEISGIPPKTLRYRIVNGWDENDLFSPVDRTLKRKKNKIIVFREE